MYDVPVTPHGLASCFDDGRARLLRVGDQAVVLLDDSAILRTAWDWDSDARADAVSSPDPRMADGLASIFSAPPVQTGEASLGSLILWASRAGVVPYAFDPQAVMDRVYSRRLIREVLQLFVLMPTLSADSVLDVCFVASERQGELLTIAPRGRSDCGVFLMPMMDNVGDDPAPVEWCNEGAENVTRYGSPSSNEGVRMPKQVQVAVNLSVAEWRVLSAIMDEVSERLATKDTSALDILSIPGLTETDIPMVKQLAKLGSNDEEYDGGPNGTVEDFLLVAGLHKKIKDQVGLEDE